MIDESIAGGASDLLITAKIGGTVVKNTVHLAKKAEYIQGIYAELARIRSAYLETVQDDPEEAEEAADTVRREVRTLGARIARELLGDEVNRLLWNRRRRISHLVLQTSGELDIPWEMVHLVPVGTQRPDKERFFLGDLGLTRWMYGTVRPTVIPIDTSRVVAIAPDYVNPTLNSPAPARRSRRSASSWARTPVPPPTPSSCVRRSPTASTSSTSPVTAGGATPTRSGRRSPSPRSRRTTTTAPARTPTPMHAATFPS